MPYKDCQCNVNRNEVRVHILIVSAILTEQTSCHIMIVSAVLTGTNFACSFCLIIFRLIVHSSDVFPNNSQKIFSLKVRLLKVCMALAKQLGNDSW